MATSNLQELKDAVVELIKFTCNSCEPHYCGEDMEQEDGQSIPTPCSAILRVRNALSANPIRNCDALSKEEALAELDSRSFSKEDTIEWLYAVKGETDGSK